jgi:uncharacterized hydrophobic protein (TIGR00271 family)
MRVSHPVKRDSVEVIHVRVVSPADVTPGLLGFLSGEDGIVNLVRLSESTARPEGDAVQFDVVNGAANRVLERLRRLGIAERGSIVMESVDTVVSDTVTALEERQSRFEDFTPVWEHVEARIKADGIYPPSWFVLLVIAGLIGAVGLLTNSQILIVGAMVVGPEYGAISNVSFGITKHERHRVLAASGAMVVGFSLAVLAALGFGLIIRWTGKEPRAFALGVRPVTQLIDTPNIYSFVVAFLAAIVGVVSLTTSRASTLIGVFISVTTIPAAADIGVALAFSSWNEARGSFLQLLLNVTVLTLVGAFALVVQRGIWTRAGRRADRRKMA